MKDLLFFVVSRKYSNDKLTELMVLICIEREPVFSSSGRC